MTYSRDTPTVSRSLGESRDNSCIPGRYRPVALDAGHKAGRRSVQLHSRKAYRAICCNCTAFAFDAALRERERERGGLWQQRVRSRLRDSSGPHDIAPRNRRHRLDAKRKRFVDLHNAEISTLVKLYPWEWLMREAFGPHILERNCKWIEPPWKALLSNKALLAALWELFPDHPNLLPTYLEPGGIDGDYVQKPRLAREGANVSIHGKAGGMASGGTYGPWAMPLRVSAFVRTRLRSRPMPAASCRRRRSAQRRPTDCRLRPSTPAVGYSVRTNDQSSAALCDWWHCAGPRGEDTLSRITSFH